MEKTNRSPSEHLASLPAGRREEMTRLDTLITGIMAGEPRTMWEGRFWGGSAQQIIGYGNYTYSKSNKETAEWFIVGLASQKNYISIYVNATTENGYITQKHADKLGRVKVGKSSISFDSIDEIDLEQLSALITEARELMSKPYP